MTFLYIKLFDLHTVLGQSHHCVVFCKFGDWSVEVITKNEAKGVAQDVACKTELGS